MLRYLSADIYIRSEKRTVFRERSSRKTVRFEEQIMSKDKYLTIFSRQMEAIVFIILQIFFATRAVLKIGKYSRIFIRYSWGIFCHVTCLDQSRASANIWWIISYDICPRTLSVPRSEQFSESVASQNVEMVPFDVVTSCLWSAIAEEWSWVLNI